MQLIVLFKRKELQQKQAATAAENQKATSTTKKGMNIFEVFKSINVNIWLKSLKIAEMSFRKRLEIKREIKRLSPI